MLSALWTGGAISLDPEGSTAGGLEGLGPVGLILAPLGLAGVGRVLHLRKTTHWIALMAVGLPIAVVLILIGWLWFSALAGEPF